MIQNAKFGQNRQMGGTMQNNSNSRSMREQMKRSEHAMSKESLLKAPGLFNKDIQNPRLQSGVVRPTKGVNRLVPVPPP